MSLTVECIGIQVDWMHRCTSKADKFKLNQVVRNFMSNALKFCRFSKGKFKVVECIAHVPRRLVRSMPSPEPVMISHVARVSVSDNGSGISEENQKKLIGKHVQFNAGQLWSRFSFELPLFATLSPEDEIAYEEIYESSVNNAEYIHGFGGEIPDIIRY
eukprot:gene26357-34994_t